jgi:hypothetical protein
VSSRFRFELAGPADDADLRELMAQGRMEGRIAVSFRREPSYFAGCAVQGDGAQVIKCMEVATGRLVGHGCRSTLEVFVGGKPARIGYLSDLRSFASYRGGTLLARGYRYLRELHDADPVPFYYTVIYEGNEQAVSNLVGGRAGLPVYLDHGRILTPAIRLDLPRRELRLPGLRITGATAAQLPEIIAFLNHWQSGRELAPVRHQAQFAPGGRYSGLRAEDFLLALDDAGRIAGTLAIWDQAAIRQTHVERYSRGLALARPLYNLAAHVLPFKPLPPVGARVPYVYLACACTREQEVATFRVLLRAAYRRLRSTGAHYAILGLHETDPLAAALRDYRSIAAAGRLYLAHYADSPAPPRGGIPYVEAGCL